MEAPPKRSAAAPIGGANMTRAQLPAQRTIGQRCPTVSGLQRIPAEDSVPDSYATHPARRGAWRRVRTDVRLHLVKSETLQSLYSWNYPSLRSESLSTSLRKQEQAIPHARAQRRHAMDNRVVMQCVRPGWPRWHA